MLKRVTKLRNNEDGASAIEYAMIAAIIAVGIIAGLGSVKSALSGKINTVGTAVSAAG